MAAAVELAGRGVPVTVFESARQLGGRARSIEAGGNSLDNGPHLLLGAYRDCLRLIAKVHDGAPPLLRQPLELLIPGRFGLRAAALPAPLHLAWGLLTAQGLNWGERLAAARFMQAMQRRAFSLTQDTSVDALLGQERQPATARRYLWEPLCLAALNTPPSQASAQVFLHVLRDALAAGREASDMYLALTGFTQLFPAPAAEYVRRRGGEVRLSAPVRAISRQPEGFLLGTDSSQERFSHVICAVPPHRLATLATGLPQLAEAAQAAANLRYQPIYTVYLQYPPATRLPRPLLGLDILGQTQWVFDRGPTHGQAGLLAAVISAEGGHEALGHDALAALASEAIARLLDNPALTPSWSQVVAEKRATFACTPGLPRPAQITPLPNLYLAGDYTASDYPATLESAVRSGIACARAIQ